MEMSYFDLYRDALTGEVFLFDMLFDLDLKLPF